MVTKALLDGIINLPECAECGGEVRPGHPEGTIQVVCRGAGDSIHRPLVS
jgi:hypothetical protein